MSAFTPEMLDEMSRLFAQWADTSRLSVLIRQLQGGVLANAWEATVTVTWAGGVARSGFVTITHNFGQPARVLTQAQDKSVTGATIGVLGQVTNSSFDVAAETPNFLPPAGSTQQITVVYWEQ